MIIVIQALGLARINNNTEKTIFSFPFTVNWDMIVVTVFELNGISIWFKNCHHDHIPFTVKGNGNIVFSVNRTFIGSFSCNFEPIGVPFGLKSNGKLSPRSYSIL